MQIKLFLIFSLVIGLLFSAASLEAADPNCDTTEKEFLTKLDKLNQELKPLKRKKYLWKWSYIHIYCLIHHRSCRALHEAETEFPVKKFSQMLKKLEETSQKIKIKLRVHKPPYTPELCRDIQLDLLSMSHTINSRLKPPLNKIEQLYNKIFGKKKN